MGTKERELDADLNNHRGIDEKENAEQDAMSREVLRDIWIKEGNDWDLGDIMGEQKGHHNRLNNITRHTRRENCMSSGRTTQTP